MTLRRNSSDTSAVQQLVKQYPPVTQDIIAAARRVMLAAFLQADETADAKARLIAYGYCSGYKGVVATLILSKAGVKIGIPYGVTLPDPTGLLEGAGKIHRHVVIASRADLARRALSTLLRATLAAWQERSRRA